MNIDYIRASTDSLRQNLLGKQFGKLTVIEYLGNKDKKCWWLAKCECGNTITKITAEFNRGTATSCGKCRRDLTGKKFHSLTVIQKAYSTKKHVFWLCRCDCGKEKLIHTSKLKKYKSCGCSKNIKNNKHVLWRGCGEISAKFFKEIIANGQRRNFEFSLNIEYLWELFLKQERKCALTGLELYFPYNSTDTKATASLDRIDSSKAYIVGNVQWVHKDINRMKWAYDEKYFIYLCKLVAEKNK